MESQSRGQFTLTPGSRYMPTRTRGDEVLPDPHQATTEGVPSVCRTQPSGESHHKQQPATTSPSVGLTAITQQETQQHATPTGRQPRETPPGGTRWRCGCERCMPVLVGYDRYRYSELLEPGEELYFPEQSRRGSDWGGVGKQGK